VTRHKQVSDVTAHAIDEEVRGLVDSCYNEAKQVLTENEDKLHVMAAALMKYETIDETQIKDIMNDREPRPPEGWDEPGDGELGKVETADSKGKGAAPLGGPAGQH
jgi:cell division protease FtsH